MKGRQRAKRIRSIRTPKSDLRRAFGGNNKTGEQTCLGGFEQTNGCVRTPLATVNRKTTTYRGRRGRSRFGFRRGVGLEGYGSMKIKSKKKNISKNRLRMLFRFHHRTERFTTHHAVGDVHDWPLRRGKRNGKFPRRTWIARTGGGWQNVGHEITLKQCASRSRRYCYL